MSSIEGRVVSSSVLKDADLCPYTDISLSWGQWVARAAIIAGIAFAVLVGNILTLGTPLICRLISDYSKKDLRMEIARRQIEHLRTAQLDEKSLEGIEDHFAKRVLYLKDQIRACHVQKDSVEKLYQTFQGFAKDEKFMRVFHDLGRHPAVQFLKDLSVKFRSAPMEDQIIDHARSRYRYVGKRTLEGTAAILRKDQEELGFRRKGLNSVFWALAHPDCWVHSLDSILFPHAYNSQQSNPTYCAHKMQYLGKQVEFIIGSTPFNDPVYSEIFSKCGREIRFNVMDWSEGHERGWIEKMQRIADQSEGLDHIAMGFSKREFLKSDAFINAYRDALLKQKIPMSNDEIRLLSEEIKGMFKDVDSQDRLTKHAILIAFDALMGAKMIHKKVQEEDSEEPLQIAIACKQCFDRGPIYFAAILYFLKNGEMDDTTFYLLAGLPMFRAPLSENRKQFDDRFRVYERFTQVMNLPAVLEERRAHL